MPAGKYFKSLIGGGAKAVKGGSKAIGSSFVGGGVATKAAFGMAATAGAISAVLEPNSAWEDTRNVMFGQGTETVIGDQLKGAVNTAVFGRGMERTGVNDWYNGGPASFRSSGSNRPVPGDVVFGMWNLRR